MRQTGTMNTRSYVGMPRQTTLFIVVQIVAALVVAAGAPTLRAQDTTRAVPIDSLAERLRRAEEAIALLREQVATEAASKVQAASRVRLDLFGRVLMNGYSNSGRVNNVDVPVFVAPDTGTRPEGGLGATVRQTSFGIALAVERVLGGRFEGELHTDFYGGQQPSSGGRRFPLLRIRTAQGTLRWERAELLVGQADPLVAGVNPVSTASFGTPEFVAAGNLWLWLPQIRGTWILFAPAGLALQGAVLAPTSGDAVAAFDTDFDAAEDTGRPFLQGRLRAQWGSEEARGEIGVGVHRGWLRRPNGSIAPSEAVAFDAVIPLGAIVELRGELYTGRALRGLGGGGISQSLTTAGAPVRDRGGWAQLEVTPRVWWSMGGGCGIGDPKDEGLPAGRLRNRACEAHVTARPDGPLLVSLGWRGHQTTYTSGPVRNTHFNVAAGFEF